MTNAVTGHFYSSYCYFNKNGHTRVREDPTFSEGFKMTIILTVLWWVGEQVAVGHRLKMN